MATISWNLGSALTGLTLTATGSDVDTDHYIVESDGSTESYNSDNETDYQHSATEPDRPGRYVISVSDDLAADTTVEWVLEDDDGNVWASKTMRWDGTNWHNIPTDAAAAKAAAEAVDNLTKAGGDGDMAAIKAKTDVYPFTITPLTATPSAGSVSEHQMTAYQHLRFGPYVYTVMDSDGDVVNLEGKTVKYTMWKIGSPETALHTLSSSASEIAISSTDYNVVTVTGTDSMTGTAGEFNYQLENTTDDQMLDVGTVTIEPSHATT